MQAIIQSNYKFYLVFFNFQFKLKITCKVQVKQVVVSL